ncbi:hypothetical protein [Burkholderia ubonensis]|uniref:hypothetical protein n=1 Tax=Burkholderia ubonensis TaxID=101571 RepID=UPI000A50C9C5|nr:hypothetical protein [Burkholderia ubonensis]
MKNAPSFLSLTLSANSAFANEIVQTCKTPKHTVIVDQISQNKHRYRAWNRPKNIQEKPDLELTSGTSGAMGSGACDIEIYPFKKGTLEINVNKGVSCSESASEVPENLIGALYVSIKGDIKSHHYCQK